METVGNHRETAWKPSETVSLAMMETMETVSL
jgi:hypothetical protein